MLHTFFEEGEIKSSYFWMKETFENSIIVKKPYKVYINFLQEPDNLNAKWLLKVVFSFEVQGQVFFP